MAESWAISSAYLEARIFILKKLKGTVLSSEMYLAEFRLIRWVVIKERGPEVFWKNPHVPDPVTVPFNFTAPFRTVIGN
jgi:hypothetical protein